MTGLALPDVNLRLAGHLPRVLLPRVTEEEAKRLVGMLEVLGFAAFACAPEAAPRDNARVVARDLAYVDGVLSVADKGGSVYGCPLGAIRLLQRGERLEKHKKVTITSELRVFDATAVLTAPPSGGNPEELFLLAQRNDGEPDIIFYEQRLDYRFLGAGMRATTRGNLEVVWGGLCALLPSVPADDTVSRPGFVPSMPKVGVDPVDLALFLVATAHERLARPAP